MKNFNDIHVTKYKQIINNLISSLGEAEELGFDVKSAAYFTNVYEGFSKLLLKIIKAQNEGIDTYLEKEDFIEGLNVLRTFYDNQDDFEGLTLVENYIKFFYNTAMYFVWNYFMLLADCVDTTDYFIAGNLVKNYIFRKIDMSADDIWKRFN